MAERSWLWDGTTTGDATLAPYGKDNINKWFVWPHNAGNQDTVCIMPGYLDNLAIRGTFASIAAVSVSPGAAMVGDYFYINDERIVFNFTSLSAANLRRYDILALRIDNTAGGANQKTVRLVKIEGEETVNTLATPLPVLQQTADVWEVELARILIAPTNSSDSAIVHVESRAAYKLSYENIYSNRNFIVNSEFLDPEASFSTTKKFNGWELVTTGAPTVTMSAPGTHIDGSTRARSVSIASAPLNTYLTQTIPLARSLSSAPRIVTVGGCIQPQGNADLVKVKFETVTQDMVVIEELFSVTILGEATPTTKQLLETFVVADSEAAGLKISIINEGTAGDSFKVGQFWATLGFHTGGVRPVHEIMMTTPITDASWDGDAKSTGTTAIDLASSFSALVPRYTKAIILELRARDSGSAASANCGLDIQDSESSVNHGGVELSGEGNDKIRTRQVIVPMQDYWKDGDVSVWGFKAVVRATGASTLDAWIEIAGIIV